MNANKFLYECWVFIKKMKQNSNITSDSLLSSLSSLNACRSMHGTLLYRMLYDDRFNKMKGIFRQIDNTFIKITEQKNVCFHLNRLKVLLKYEMPYESSLQDLMPLLKQPVSRTVLIDACSCLQHVPHFRTETFTVFITHLFKLIEQELDNTLIIDKVFLMNLLRLMSRSSYQIPKNLHKKLDNLLNSSL